MNRAAEGVGERTEVSQEIVLHNKSLQLSPYVTSDLKNGVRKCSQCGLMRRRN